MPVVHCKHEKFDVYIGRQMPGFNGSMFANQYRIGVDGTRPEVLKKYELWLREQLRNSPFLMKEILKLDGKVLGCWCSPKPCHGDIIIKLINELKLEQQFLVF